ncbi:MAG: adenylate/guanylate cyclase domain-containing protein [Balneolaceae bacterium]
MGQHSGLIKTIGINALLTVAVFTAALGFGYLTPVQVMELKMRDWLFELRGEQELDHSDIVIVEMSQSADEEIPYKYPWPTSIYAKMIENLNRAGVKAIGIDVIYDQRDVYDLANDTLFAEALEKYGNVVLAGSISSRIQHGRDGTAREQRTLVGPNDVLRERSPNPVGLVNMTTDPDEFIRNYLLYASLIDQNYYSLALEMARLYFDVSEEEIVRATDHLQFGPLRIPVRYNTIPINYYGGGRSISYLSLEEIIDDQEFDTLTEMEAFEMNLFDDPEYGILHQGILEGKIVLVGATMPELQDLHPVPVKNEVGGALMPGVEIHAHALQMLLDQNFLWVVPDAPQAALLLLISLFIVVMTRRLPAWGSGLVMLLTLAGWLSLSVWLFIAHQFILYYLGPVFAIAGGYGGITAWQYVQEEREKRRIKQMFSSYVSPELVDRMVESEEEFRLGGREAEITAFFSDVANFSTLSEQLSASSLIRLMNEYLDRMTEIVMEEEGTLDKYIGDALMAFYGAPVEVDEHALKACRTAIRQQEALQELRKRWQESDGDLPDDVLNLRIRIGINTGRMVVGNMGSSRRFNYTILGDQVNIAARCEAACKKYGIYIMVTEATRDRVLESPGHGMVFRYLDRIRVKGRVEPLRVYELAGFRSLMAEQALREVDLFEKGAQHFYNREWNKAKQQFLLAAETEEAVSGRFSATTSPSRLYIRRCDHLMANPPGEEWDGVFDQTSDL